MNSFLLPFLFGAAAGVLSAWGVGGGTLLLLCMTLVLGIDQSTARCINLLYFLPTAGVSLWFHRKNGCLDRQILRQAVPSGTLLALAAALLSTSVDKTVLDKPFGLFLLYAGVSITLGKRDRDI